MPKIDQSQLASGAQGPQPYGVNETNNKKTLQERLMDRFAPHEFVIVKNVDDMPVMWQYLPATSEEFEYTPDPMKITRRGQPELWQIEPGAEEALVGANAYLMIDAMYKQLVAKKKLANGNPQPGQALNFNFADGGQQEAFINQIFLGKTQPNFQLPGEVVAAEDLAPREIVPKKEVTGVVGGGK